MFYYSNNRQPIPISAPIAKGGEGTIHELAGHPTKLVKVYSKPLTSLAQRKLQAMVSHRTLAGHRRLAWPEAVVLDAQGNVAGFVMKKVPGIPLVPLTALCLRSKELPHFTQFHLCRVVHDMAAGLDVLAKKRVYPGDISMNNFLMDPTTGEVSFIDCDSFQIPTGTGQAPFLCPVMTPEFQPPERLNRDAAATAITEAQVTFSMAILAFMVLTAGGHPYQVYGGESPEANIRAGRHFLGGKGCATGATTPEIFARYCSLSPWVMSLFKRTFIGGHLQPSERPQLEEWIKAVKAFGQSLEFKAPSVATR